MSEHPRIARDTSRPRHAERLDLFKSLRTLKQPSRLIPGREQLIEQFACPACDEVQPVPNSRTECPKCGLMMLACINDLYVWRDEQATA